MSEHQTDAAPASDGAEAAASAPASFSPYVAQAPVVPTTLPAPDAPPEPPQRYAAAHLILNASAAFGCRPEVVRAALAHAGLTMATRDECARAIQTALAAPAHGA